MCSKMQQNVEIPTSYEDSIPVIGNLEACYFLTATLKLKSNRAV